MACVKLLLCALLHFLLSGETVVQAMFSRQVCYEDYGCFVPRPGSMILPDSPEKVNTRFFLYTRENSTEPQLISAADDLTFLDVTKPVKVIIHGFLDKASNEWIRKMAIELLLSEDVYVIAVDWSGGNQFPYSQAVANTAMAAAAARPLLLAMIAEGVTPQQIHLIGHSLGAHICSYIGRDIPNIGRISGLDPAGPEFYKSGVIDRLDQSDALFVDVLHTDGATHMIGGFGYTEPLGHVDYYPNGGSAQPTCASNTGNVLSQSLWELVSTWDVGKASQTVSCNHMSALFYYTDSINTPSPAFGYPCASYDDFVQGLCTSCAPSGTECQHVGYHASPNRTLGSLYFMTIHGIEPPHFGFHYKVSLHSSSNNEKYTRGAFQITFNDQEEDIALFDKNTLFERNGIYSKTVLLTTKPVPLQTVTISFKRTTDLMHTFGLAKQWNFNTVTVFDMQTNNEYTFCPQSPSATTVQSGSSLTYKLCV